MPASFVFSLSGLEPGSGPQPVHLAVPVDWGVELVRLLPDPPLTADLTLEAVPGGVVVRGVVVFVVRETCHRCLTETDVARSIDVMALFEHDPADENDYRVMGDAIDVEQMLRDEVLLSLPLLPRCSETCAGVVTTPESGLNTEPPGGHTAEESPFAALRDLLPGMYERNEAS